MKKIFSILIIVLALQSCENKTQKTSAKATIAKDTVNNNTHLQVNEEPKKVDNSTQEADITYPKTGKKATDFLPNQYEIQYTAEGDLNGDNLKDIAVVFKHKAVKTRQRPVLILLRNEDQSYRLDKVSNLVMPIEYNEFDFKLFDTEEVSIEKGALTFKLYGKDNAFGTFQYSGSDLVLTTIEAFYRGAGAQDGIKYDFIKGEQSTTKIEFLSDQDDPKVTESTDPIKKERHLFESTSITEFFN